jgi:hypothetical protein
MKSTRRTTTTVEVREVVVIRANRGREQVLCAECADGGLLVPVDEAAKMSGFSARAIYRLIEAGDIHFAETAGVSTLICAATLLLQIAKQIKAE